MATSKHQPVTIAKQKKIKADRPLPIKYEEAHFIDSLKPVWNYSFLSTKTFLILRTVLFIMAIKNLAAIKCRF